MRIDLNADLGEGFATDAEMLKWVSSANIACGWHAGDADTMAATVDAAASRAVAIGCHPGLPDRANFGRLPMDLTSSQVFNLTLAQIGALAAFASTWARRLAHVKPHGALYWMAERSDDYALAVVDAVRAFDPRLAVVGLAGGNLVAVASRRGVLGVPEVFADRAYKRNGALVDRAQPGATIADAAAAAERMARWVETGRMPAVDGAQVEVAAQTICVHGDSPEALGIAAAVRQRLEAMGIEIVAAGAP